MKKTVQKRNNIYLTELDKARFIQESNNIEEIPTVIETVQSGFLAKLDLPEVDNHIRAMKYILDFPFDGKLNIDVMEKLHKTLMKHLLPDSWLGLRTDWVRIGNRVCPPPIALKPMLEIWCDKVNKFKKPTEEEIWQSHLAFEYIHPFMDGNGRSGRLLWLYLRLKHDLGFAFIENDTKFANYYPEFDTFTWGRWENS